MVPNPTPSSKAMTKKQTVVADRFQFTVQPHALNPKKQVHTRYMPVWMTCVIIPLSTSLPENSRDTAMPTAMSVKKNPVEALRTE